MIRSKHSKKYHYCPLSVFNIHLLLSNQVEVESKKKGSSNETISKAIAFRVGMLLPFGWTWAGRHLLRIDCILLQKEEASFSKQETLIIANDQTKLCYGIVETIVGTHTSNFFRRKIVPSVIMSTPRASLGKIKCLDTTCSTPIAASRIAIIVCYALGSACKVYVTMMVRIGIEI